MVGENKIGSGEFIYMGPLSRYSELVSLMLRFRELKRTVTAYSVSWPNHG